MSWTRHVETTVPDLHFQVESVASTRSAITPQLTFKLRITNSEGNAIHSVALRAQVQIDPVRRRYTPAEQEHLKELFGEPERWSSSLHPLLWTNTNVTVPGFTGSTVVDVPVPCTFDFNVAVTKYIFGLEEGEIPTSLLFSGTVFHAAQAGLQVQQIPWDREASYRMPVSVWKEMMDIYYPNTAWLCLSRESFERLYAYRARHGIPTWEQTFERLLGVTVGVNS
jgi:Family of unknown function (DUF6084)